MAASGHDDGDGHGDDGHGEGDGDRGTWILAVLAAAVVAFVVAALVIRAAGLDEAVVAEPAVGHVESAEAADGGSEGDAAPDPVATAVPVDPTTTVAAADTSTSAAPTTTTSAPAPAPDGDPAATTTPIPAPAAPSARPGGDGATAEESAAAVTFARLVRTSCDLSGVPDPGQVRSVRLEDQLFQITDANGTVLQLDLALEVVRAADSLDGTVPGGYSDACSPALFGA